MSFSKKYFTNFHDCDGNCFHRSLKYKSFCFFEPLFHQFWWVVCWQFPKGDDLPYFMQITKLCNLTSADNVRALKFSIKGGSLVCLNVPVWILTQNSTQNMNSVEWCFFWQGTQPEDHLPWNETCVENSQQTNLAKRNCFPKNLCDQPERFLSACVTT